ncbi:MAG: tRNA 4-thiouridine(8) synthase ThiI [Butyrivibrio sp.]|nr:tRNA 4-thiouridine(8) synthase ThiI [Butyrivibrio sp.]
MDYQAFLIKYAEIAVKGKNRSAFEDTLVRRIEEALTPCAGEFRVRRVTGRIYVEAQHYDFDETIQALQHVFGINGICPAVCIPRIMPADGHGKGKLPTPEALSAAVVDFLKSVYPRETADTTGEKTSFKIQVRRVDKTYPMDSMELGAEIGAAVLDACPGLCVDVHAPDILFHVELREQVNLFSQVIEGPGGMPLGTGGRAMLLLSGGIDSPVAGYMVARRGVILDAVYFNAPPYTSERALQKVVDLAAILAKYTGPIRLHIINFTAIQMYIYEKCPHDELTIIMRRYMMRIAERLGIEAGAMGLVTGESIGQVASQTMESLLCTDEVVETMPVYRPLIAFDKQDIIDRSEAIGAYDTSILPYEDCCTIFVARHPVTKPRREIIRRHERLLSGEIDNLVQQALDTDEVREITGVY